MGFDARHVVTIWMGRPDGTPVPGAFGADLAAPVLFEAFTRGELDLRELSDRELLALNDRVTERRERRDTR